MKVVVQYTVVIAIFVLGFALVYVEKQFNSLMIARRKRNAINYDIHNSIPWPPFSDAEFVAIRESWKRQDITAKGQERLSRVTADMEAIFQGTLHVR